MPWSLSNCKLIANFGPKMKALKFGTKNTLFGCFGLDVQKTIIAIFDIFEIKTLKFVYNSKGYKKQKPTKKKRTKQTNKSKDAGPKMPDWFIFRLEFENNFFIFEIITLEFVWLHTLVHM